MDPDELAAHWAQINGGWQAPQGPRSRTICNVGLAGNPAGGGTGGAGAGGDPKPPFDQSQMDALNSAITGHLKRLPLGDMISAALTTALPGLLKQIQDGLAPQIAEAVKAAVPQPDPNQPAGGGKGKIPDEVQNQLTQLAAQNKALQDKLSAQENAAKAAREEADLQLGRTSLSQALAEIGVGAAYMDAALALHGGKVKIDEKTKKPFIEVERDQYNQKYKEQLDLGAWAKEWAETDAGKAMIPARGPGGGGGGGGRPNVTVRRPGAGGPANGSYQTVKTKDGKIDQRASDSALGTLIMGAIEAGGDDTI